MRRVTFLKQKLFKVVWPVGDDRSKFDGISYNYDSFFIKLANFVTMSHFKCFFLLPPITKILPKYMCILH